jgi:hypothetical protein
MVSIQPPRKSIVRLLGFVMLLHFIKTSCRALAAIPDPAADSLPEKSPKKTVKPLIIRFFFACFACVLHRAPLLSSSNQPHISLHIPPG